MALELTTTNAEVKVEGTEALTTLTVNQTAVSIEVAQSGPQGVGVPAGGTTGQVLAKTSNSDYATGWTSASGGVTDHGALTGLADDDHKQYQRADSTFTTTDPFTITDESLVVTTGAAVTLPDAQSNVGRMVSVAAASQFVTVSPAGTDVFHGVTGNYIIPINSGVTFTSANIGGWGWAVTNEQGIVANLPQWYDVATGASTLTDGNVLSVVTVSGLSIPAWTTGTRTAQQFLSGTGWTDDVPVLIPVKNTTASTIAKGTPVYATGTVGATSTIEIAPADADDAAKMPAIGLTESQLTNNATGYVIVLGTVKGVDTSTYSINQALYVSTTAGQLTATKPTGTSELIQNVGRVTRVNANNGEILVLGPGRTNDVPNAIDAGKLTSGTVDTARLGTGTASASTFLRGDQTWAKPTPWTVITDTTASVAVANFSVTVTGYTELQVMLTGLGDSTGGASIGVRMRFNGDTGNNYLNNSGAATSAWNAIGSLPSSLTNTDRNGVWMGTVSLGGSGRYTAAVYQNGFVASTATTGLAQSSSSGSAYYINTTAAIDTLLIYPSADNWAAGTRLLVRGR